VRWNGNVCVIASVASPGGDVNIHIVLDQLQLDWILNKPESQVYPLTFAARDITTGKVAVAPND